MAEAVVPHVIGTTAMIVLFFILGTFYTGLFTRLNSEAYRAQLGQTTEYITSNIIDLVSLSHLTENDVFLLKVVQPPIFIGERVYDIDLITMASSHGDNLFARARIDRLNIYAVSELPFTLTHVQLYEGQEIAHPDNIILARNLSSDAAISQSAMTKSSAELVVWCSKSDGVVTVGLGIMDRP